MTSAVKFPDIFHLWNVEFESVANAFCKAPCVCCLVNILLILLFLLLLYSESVRRKAVLTYRDHNDIPRLVLKPVAFVVQLLSIKQKKRNLLIASFPYFGMNCCKVI